MLRSGSMDRRIELQAKTVTRDDIGEEQETWTTFATVWANVQGLRGKEFFAAAEMQDAVDLRIRIRYRDDVTRDQRIVFEGQSLDIASLVETGRREGLEIMCVSGVRNGR